MAPSRQPGPIGMSRDVAYIQDGTSVLTVSNRPGVTGTKPGARRWVKEGVSCYEVKAGDSWWKIAATQLGAGTLASELARLNGASSTALLYPGDKLIVPDYRRYDLTIKFILNEMLTNAQSSEAKEIAEVLAKKKELERQGNLALEDLKAARWYSVFRQYADLKVAENAMYAAAGLMVYAKALWFKKVHANGPWDHKPMLRRKYEAFPSPPRPFGQPGKAYHFPIRGDIFHEYYYDIWSNVHYGYVGSRCGFDASTLQDGAALGLPGFGENDEGDVISTQIGIDLWNAHGLKVDAELLRSAIIAKTSAYLGARERAIQRGVPAQNAVNVVISGNDYK